MQPHGTDTRYKLNGCRCRPCTDAHNVYARAYKTGHRRWVSTTPARDHINALRAQGWTVQAIADRSGYHEQTVRNIGNGKTQFTSRFIAEDICSIPVEAIA